MKVICVVSGILFFLLGLLLFIGKLHPHLDLWKKLSKEDQEKIRIIPLCRNMGAMICLCGLIFFVSGMFWTAGMSRIFIWLMIAWFVLSGIDVYWIQTSNRYQNPPFF